MLRFFPFRIKITHLIPHKSIVFCGTEFGSAPRLPQCNMKNRIVKEFSKGREGFNMVAGIFEGSFVDGISINKIAALPSKQELLAQLVGSLNAPVSGFVNVLAGNLRGLVCVLNAIAETKG